VAVFALWSGDYLSAQLVRDEVKTITDSQNRNSQPKHPIISRRSIVIVDRAGPTREDDAGRPVARDLIQRGCAGKYDLEDSLLADPSRNELRVLGAKVEDDDGGGLHTRVSQNAKSISTIACSGRNSAHLRIFGKSDVRAMEFAFNRPKGLMTPTIFLAGVSPCSKPLR